MKMEHEKIILLLEKAIEELKTGKTDLLDFLIMYRDNGFSEANTNINITIKGAYLL